MRKWNRTCQECGTAFVAVKSDQRHCSTGCRKKFNNRRMTRGAELLDYFMSVRYERKTHASALAVMSQMANAWREEDAALRGGRQSWISPDLTDDPRAFEIVQKNIRKAS